MNQTPSPVCLVTGGSSGIGLATAKRFAANGYQIAICGRRSETLNAAKAAIEESSIARSATDSISLQCQAIVADLNDVEQAKAVGQSVLSEFGRIDVLVNNAGTAPLVPFADITAETFESSLNTNVRSIFYLTQIAWRAMLAAQQGTIVNISSLSAVDPFPGFSLYGASKAWMDLLTLALAAEGKEAGIRVCSVRPGAVETPMLRGLFPDFPSDQCVQPDDIAQTVWGCVSDPAAFPSGGAFPVTNQPGA